MSIFDDPDDPDDLPVPDPFEASSGALDPVGILDSESGVLGRDPGRLLWGLATAGAQVRRAVADADRWRDERVAADEAPRALLVATDTSAGVAGGLLGALGGDRTAVVEWTAASLPRWAGPADVLLAASIDGRHPRIAMLVAEAVRRGLTVVVVTLPDTPVAAAAAGRGIVVAIEAPVSRRAAQWALLTPLLLAAHSLQVIAVSDTDLEGVADVLDQVAELCRPAGDAFVNAAKQLAIEVIETEAMIVGIGPFATLAARCFTNSLALVAGLAATPLSLPDDVTRAGALLDIPIGPAVPADEDDFFRDRVEEPARRRRLVFLADVGPDGERERPPEAGDELARAGDLAAIALGHIAAARHVVATTLDLPGATPLTRFAAASAFGDFTAAYAAIGRDIDPTAARAGELPH